MTTPRRPQARSCIIVETRAELEAIAAEGRDALAGVHDGLTDALADLVARVDKLARTLAGPDLKPPTSPLMVSGRPAPRESGAGQPSRSTPRSFSR